MERLQTRAARIILKDSNLTYHQLNNGCKYMKIIFVHCGLGNEYRIDPRSYERYKTTE